MDINCDMCGSESQLFKTEVEGAVLKLCGKCVRHGKVISAVREEPNHSKLKNQQKSKKEPEVERMLIILQDYPQKVKQAREKLGLKQEDFAKQVNEKVSIIHHIETGTFEPGFELARKLEKFLKIKIVEEHEETHNLNCKQEKREHFTLGDFIKVRNKKT